MQGVRAALHRILAAEHPATVRQVFYRLVSEGVIDKTETEYRGTVVRLLTSMRREGVVPFEWIADNTRWMRKSQSFHGLEHALYQTALAYRRAVWANQAAYVEVWLEKDALAGVLMEETDAWDVPLMVTRGYPSLTFLHSAAEQIAAEDKPCFLYYFGDFDPSGVDIPRQVEKNLRTLAPNADLRFERIAVNEDQIVTWNLPTRPTKRTDARSRHFKGESVEVDAIPPDQLRVLAANAIQQHIDDSALHLLRVAEQSERELLYAMARQATSQ
jgi:hypothetical protein